MGQYHIPVNLDKKEYLDPHALGAGLKLWEQLVNKPSTGQALVILLACSNGRGGGDIKADDPDGMIGRWAGDRIAIVGDYAVDEDLDHDDYAGSIYDMCIDEYTENGIAYKDITPAVCKIIEQELDGKYSGDGWRDWVPNERRKNYVIHFGDE